MNVGVSHPGAVSPIAGAMSAGDLAELMSAFNDVTARLQQTHESLQMEVVRLKEELREANEALQRSKRLAALGEMAAGIAHEVRNPLGSIGLYARMLEQDLADRPSERALAVKIAAAVHGLNAVVGDVLSFAREVRVVHEEIEAGEALRHVAEVCLADAPIRPKVEISGGGVRIWADGMLLQQALVNIVRNAIDAMAELPRESGHRLRLSARAIETGEVAIAVSDTGPGVSDEAIDRMFNPFFTTRKTGTGLGLAIVHRIVDAHAGRVLVRNNAGDDEAGGATFEVVLPGRGGARARVETSKKIRVRRGRDARTAQEQSA